MTLPFLFNERFFTTKPIGSPRYEVNAQNQVNVKETPWQNRYWKKLAAPQEDLFNVYKQINLMIEGLNKYISDGSPNLYSDGIITYFKNFAPDTLEQNADNFKAHLTQLNKLFTSAEQKQAGCLHGLIMRIINFTRTFFRQAPAIDWPIQSFGSEELEHFINQLKESVTSKIFKTQIYAISNPDLNSESIDHLLRLLAIDTKFSNFSFKIDNEHTLCIQVERLPQQKIQYGVQVTPVSPGYSFRYEVEDRFWYQSLDDNNLHFAPSNTESFAIIKLPTTINTELNLPLENDQMILSFKLDE